jgi:hypothetical protein
MEAPMRLLTSTLSTLFLATAAHAAGVTERVDLNAPGAIESLRSARPAHYDKVRAILEYAGTHPTHPATRPLLEARFDAADIEMLQWRVSNPPKLKVSFTLDTTRYTAEVIPNLSPARAMPAR